MKYYSSILKTLIICKESVKLETSQSLAVVKKNLTKSSSGDKNLINSSTNDKNLIISSSDDKNLSS